MVRGGIAFPPACPSFARVPQESMKAVILAAGKGTRMRELTNELPKPMLKVWDKPILEHILSGLMTAGIRDFFMVTGYRAEAVEDYFGDGRRWGVKISYGRQVVQDGTGKAPEVAKAWVGTDDFLLTYGDILVKPDTYQNMVRRFAEAAFAGLVTVTRGADVAKGAIVIFDRDFCLKKLVEKPSLQDLEALRQAGDLRPGDPYWYNAGIYVFKPLVYEYTARLRLSPRGEYELTDAISAMQAANLRLAGLEIAGRWVDVRDPDVLRELEGRQV
jgi:UDP-N-acetylglucosamine diphosphorylase / glucose-1-phosphate thymidylyltransferase / UDP-N-acetylgalactosamine diphosphorylase / glucosamine-1-phosphate N-acetyltransferase / galactosamine-1-phosphate N-acetyltransferase